MICQEAGGRHRRIVCPVQILENEQDPALGCESHQRAAHRLGHDEQRFFGRSPTGEAPVGHQGGQDGYIGSEGVVGLRRRDALREIQQRLGNV